MKNFLKNTSIFIITFSSLLAFVFLFNNGSIIINYDRFKPRIFNKKVEITVQQESPPVNEGSSTGVFVAELSF